MVVGQEISPAEQIRQFVDCLYEPGDLVEIQRLPSAHSTWHKASDLAGQAEQFESDNCNIHPGVNPRKDEGRSAADVALVRCLFLDFDDTTLMDVRLRLRDADLPAPTLQMVSGNGVHVYYRLNEPITNMKLFARYQKGLAILAQSDEKVHDLPRVMRMPGFDNVKVPDDPKPCYIVEACPDRVYALDEFAGALTAKASRNGNGTSFPYSPTMADRTDRIPKGHRNDALYRHGMNLLDDGKTSEVILANLLDFNKRLCDPPLPQDEVRKVAASVCKSVAAIVPASNSKARNAEGEQPRATDLGNAQRMAASCGDRVRYCKPWRRWLVFDGKQWKNDDRNEIVALAVETVRQIYSEAQRCDEGGERKAIAKHAVQSESAKSLRAMIGLAEHMAPVTPDELDSDPWVLNVANGSICLRTGEMRQHDRADYLTKLSPVEYHKDAKYPQWEAFLLDVMHGDRDLVAFLKRAVGYSACGDTREHVLFLQHGQGRNGKSVFTETVKSALGSYAETVPVSALMIKQGGGVPNDLARLQGSRFAAASESQEGRRLDESTIKALTGGDTIVARFMRAEFFEFTPTHTLWLSTNHRPRVMGMDIAIWSRIKLVPYTQCYEKSPDRELPNKLQKELPGILRWIVEGCLEWQRGGLNPPEAVTAATQEYKTSQDVVGDFLVDRCIDQEHAETTTASLYEAYLEWCMGAGENPWTKKRIGARLEALGYEPGRNKTTRYWRGIQLKG